MISHPLFRQIAPLLDFLIRSAVVPRRLHKASVSLAAATSPSMSSASASSPTLFAVDHHFPIKGVGRVFTGTVLAGQMSIGDTLELPGRSQFKIRSMQSMKRKRTIAHQGDRSVPNSQKQTNNFLHLCSLNLVLFLFLFVANVAALDSLLRILIWKRNCHLG